MGYNTHPADMPANPLREPYDTRGLTAGRGAGGGMCLGRYLQPPPMLFTRDGHNVFLGDMYRGCSAFLLGGGSSLTCHDLAQLDARGILTMSMNNAATVHRTQLWACVDDPGNFSEAIWYDPAIMKFVPLGHMDKHFMVRDSNQVLTPSAELVGEMPAVFGFRRNGQFHAERWLYEDTFNWGNREKQADDEGQRGARSVMYVAVRLLFYLGVRRLFLLGCDFRMQLGKQNYAFEQDRSVSSVRGNNNSYRVINARFAKLRPYFEREGFEVYNCTPDSGLTAFPHMSYEEALEAAREKMPARIITAGMYERKALEKQKQRGRQKPPAKKPHSAPTAVAKPLQSSADVERRALRRQRLASFAFTLLVWVDEVSCQTLKHTWPSWLRLKPALRKATKLVVHDSRFDLGRPDVRCLHETGDVTFLPWTVDTAGPQAESIVEALLTAALEHVKTPWFLRLDSQALATMLDESWPRRQWFAKDEGAVPALVSNVPVWTPDERFDAQIIHRLSSFPAAHSSSPHLGNGSGSRALAIERMQTPAWCLFGNTRFLRTLPRYDKLDLKLPADDILLRCAARHECRRLVEADMPGWEYFPGRQRRMQSRFAEVLGPS